MLRKPIIIMFILMFLVPSISFSALQDALCNVAKTVQSVVGALFALTVILASVVYVGGQVLGAEYRAKANVWAHSLIMGAIFGAFLYLLLPVFVNAVVPNLASSDPCGLGIFNQ